MPKIYDRHDSEMGRVTRINENLWFRVMQPQLFQLANTDYGKDLLCIPKGYKKIFKFGKNHIFHNPRMENGKFISDWDFRVGAKWANVIRYRWEEVLGALMWQEANRFILPAVRSRVLMTAAFGGPYYPDAHVETTTVDGVSDKDDSADWATTRDAATGTAAYDDQTEQYVAVSNTGYWIRRYFALFNTAAIPDTDVISAATLSLAGAGVGETNANSSDLDVVSSNPASNTAIGTADYDQVGSTVFGSFAISGWNETSGTYNAITLTDFTGISKTGITKLAIRVSRDTDNSAPTGGNNVYAFFADQTGTSSDPKLTGTSASPSGPASLKTYNTIAKASIKTINGVAAASWKSMNGVV